MVGIYKITNKINNKVYVGQLSDIDYRWVHHRCDLKANAHHNIHLQSAWNKYGKNAFIFEVIEECDLSLLDERETFWIQFYNSYDNGYNLDHGGQGIRGYRHTQDEIDKMRRIQSPAVILQFDLSFNLLNEWLGGASHIHKTLGYTSASILLRCRHTLNGEMTPYKDSYWIYKNEYMSDEFSWEKYLKNVPCIDMGDALNIKYDRIICQYAADGSLVKEWLAPNEIIAERYNYAIIKNLCNRCVKARKHKGYLWAYKEEDINDYYKNILHPAPKPSSACVPINMLDLDGNYIKTFGSIAGASRALTGRSSLVSSIINSAKTHRTTSHGYRWEYAQ